MRLFVLSLFSGEKFLIRWYRGYLISVTLGGRVGGGRAAALASSQRGPNETMTLSIYDIQNQFVGVCESIELPHTKRQGGNSSSNWPPKYLGEIHLPAGPLNIFSIPRTNSISPLPQQEISSPFFFSSLSDDFQ